MTLINLGELKMPAPKKTIKPVYMGFLIRRYGPVLIKAAFIFTSGWILNLPSFMTMTAQSESKHPHIWKMNKNPYPRIFVKIIKYAKHENCKNTKILDRADTC